MKIGIMGAMPQEIDLVCESAEIRSSISIANRMYHEGTFEGVECVMVFSRWGKVAAAATATTLIERFGVGMIVFTGVAGGVADELNIGDVVIADRLLQHDFDVSSTGQFAKFEIPLLGISHFSVEPKLVQMAESAVGSYLDNFDISHTVLTSKPKRVTGTVASGDQFIANPERLIDLRLLIPNLKAVEMEGAAVAQICHEYRLPFVVLRTISDKADHSAPVDFVTFVSEIARRYSYGILRLLIPMLQESGL